MYADDTIAAIATPPGPGGVGIVRVSGPLCAHIADRMFSRSATAEGWRSHQLYHGHVVDAHGGALDEALAVRMPSPRSYTGEDVLEIHCHGGPVIVRRVLARVLECGARPAQPGEFTKRAFLNGRLDLAQAEAVIDLVRAGTDAAAKLAMQQLSGQLSDHLGALRAELVRLKTLLEAQIDFAEEDLVIGADELLGALDTCSVTIKDLLNTHSHGRVVREGLRVTIIGKPNVGKSSLLNALLGEERAIVTAVAGTTRDAIDDTADFDGIPITLSDTAGLRRPDNADPLERLGMQRTAATIAQSQVLLAVLDGSAPLDAEDDEVLERAAGVAHIIVLNKSDLPRRLTQDELLQRIEKSPPVIVSAKYGTGLDELRRRVASLFLDGASVNGGPILTNVRHADALHKASKSLTLARQSICEGQPPEIVAVDVQDAIDHMSAITGAVTTEEVLDRIFSEFCIGK